MDQHFGGIPEKVTIYYTEIEIDGKVHRLQGRFSKSETECCFCGRALTDESSVALGYGPECARRNGLPHRYEADPTWKIVTETVTRKSKVPPLPDWVKLIRPHQWDAYCEILYHLDAGVKVVFLSAPTGSGKTLIGEMVRRSYGKKAMYTCTTKTLQNQVERDFPYAKVIKGRANYPTLNFPDNEWFACDLCEKKRFDDDCFYCDDTEACPYQIARYAAMNADVAVANVAYMLAEGNGYVSWVRGRADKGGLTIIDEADALEDELMRHVEISLSPRLMKQLAIKPPDKKTVVESWQTWVERVCLPALRSKIKTIYGNEAKDIRFRSRLSKLVNQLDGITFGEDWVYTGYDQGYVTFKPVKVTKQAPEVLWHLGKQFLLMSATIISAQQMAEDLGLEDDEWVTVDVPSVFPVENRPIYIEPVANMTAKTKETAWPRATKRVEEIAFWHDERILVHTVSYALATQMADNLGPRAITYRSAKEREPALAKFRSSTNGILLAPSFERGVDLPYDECRVVVVAKIPFPYLGDKQINKRLYSKGGRGWYAMTTVRSLVQMTGRAMRHEDDTCEIYVIDAQFVENIWKKSKHLLPEWWKTAIHGYPRLTPSPNLAAIRGGQMK